MSQTAYNNDYAAQQQQQQYNQQYNQYNNQQQYPQQQQQYPQQYNNQQHYHSSGNQQGYNQQQYPQQQGFNQQPQGFNQQQYPQQQGFNQQQPGFNQQPQGFNQQQQQQQPGLNLKGHPVALHGFNSLTNLPYVQIRQGVEQMEVLSGFETSNKYAVLDPNGNLLMQCSEKSSMLAKLALGAGRSMDIKITDGTGAPIMDIKRPFKLYHKNVTITDPSGRLMGTVIKKFAIGKTIFHVMNGRDEQLFTIRGGAFITVGPSRKFTITNSQGTEVGHIQKEFAGLLKEAFTDADNFSIHFPPGCDGETCALLVATTLFIDLSHFEK